MKCPRCSGSYYMDNRWGLCGMCATTLVQLLEPGKYDLDSGGGRVLMADSASEFDRIVKEANNRAKYRAKDKFPDSIVRFARKVEDWFHRYDQEVTLSKFKAIFITMGEAKLGFAGYINKIVPIIHTEAEFENLLRILGYEFTDDVEADALTILVCGDKAWIDRKGMIAVLRQLPEGSTILEGGQDEGAEFLAAKVGEHLEFEVIESLCRKVEDFEELFEEHEPHGVLVFHTKPKESKRVVAIATIAKATGTPLKVVKGSHVDLTEWIDSMYEEDDDD